MDGEKPLEKMNKSELIEISKKLNIFKASLNTKNDIEYNILEYLIFGEEKLNNSSSGLIAKKSKENTKKTEQIFTKELDFKKFIEKLMNKIKSKKTNFKLKPIIKKEDPKKEISPAEKVIRDNKRKTLQEKANKIKVGKKVSLADLKKLKLTDLYGINKELESYLRENDIDNILKLSIKNINKMSKKFISGLPLLKTSTESEKKEKMAKLINEAKFMIEELTK